MTPRTRMAFSQSQPSLQVCYAMGRDCAKNGPTADNCHYALFRTPAHTKAWERGKKDAEREKEALL